MEPTPDNARAVMRALAKFGAPLDTLTAADLTRTDTIFQIGVSPRRIDISTGVDGLDFQPTYDRALMLSIEGIDVRAPKRDDLIQNKRASGRTKDLADAEWPADQP